MPDRPAVPGHADPASNRSFSPAPKLAAAVLAAGLAALAALLVVDKPGRILVGALAAALLAEGARLAIVRPVLSVDETGLHVHRIRGTRGYAWRDVRGVAAHASRRLVMLRTIEIDAEDALIVVPAYRLGADPDEVVAAIDTLRPSGD